MQLPHAFGVLALAAKLLQHAQAERGGYHDRYALSEVVIRPRADIVSLGLPRKRQDAQASTLKNNVPSTRTINPGENQVWVLPASELTSIFPSQTPYVPQLERRSGSQFGDGELRHELKRQSKPNVYFNLDICSQPGASAGSSPTSAPPGLAFYVSLSESNKSPGANFQGSYTQQTDGKHTTGGHAEYSTDEAGDTYVGVSAPTLDGFSGTWEYQLTLSTFADYTRSESASMLRFVDSDPAAALFVTERLVNDSSGTDSLRQQWLETGGPFGLFIYNASDPFAVAVESSYCGLKRYAKAFSNIPNNSTSGSETGMRIHNQTSVYQQFYVPGLQSNTSYKATLSLTSEYSRDANSNTPGGGGTLWPATDFKTRSTDNCQLVYNMSFCDNVAYSVPTNGTYSRENLSALYDNYTSGTLWSNFQNSLDQIPCNTSNDAKYSLARNCDDCASAYKNWVCAVSIPRCADMLSGAPALRLRNTNPLIGNSTWPNGTVYNSNDSAANDASNAVARNSGLESYVWQSGPYKEVLPCESLCYDLVQSCPSILGFACPIGEQLSWGYASTNSSPWIDGYPYCNLPGHHWNVSAATSLHMTTWAAVVIVICISWLWA